MYCDYARDLILNTKLSLQKLVYHKDFTYEELIAKVPHAKSFPQIFLYDEANTETYIGGYKELQTFINENKDKF